MAMAALTTAASPPKRLISSTITLATAGPAPEPPEASGKSAPRKPASATVFRKASG